MSKDDAYETGLKNHAEGHPCGVLLTLGWYFFIRPLPARIDYFREFELIAVWIILLIGWIVYLFNLWKYKK